MFLAFLLNLVINIYLIFFIMRIVINEQEFFFSPVLQPIYKATEPIFNFIQRKITILDRHLAAISITIISLLIVIRGLILHFLSTSVLLHSYLSILLFKTAPDNIKVSISLSFLNFFDFLAQAFVVLLICFFFSPPFSSNPLIRFSKAILEPLLKLSGRIFYFIRRGLPVITVFLVIFIHFLGSLFIVYFIEIDVTHGFNYFQEQIQPSSSYETDINTPPNPLKALKRSTILFNSLELFCRTIGFFTLLIIVDAIMSWFRPDPFNPLVQWIDIISRPILAPFRRIVPSIGGLDISPIIVILLLEAGRQGLTRFFFYITNII